MAKTIIFRSRYTEALSLLPPEKRLEAYEAIFSLFFNGSMGDVSNDIFPTVFLICSSIREDYEKFERRTKGDTL